jgi:protein TonB
VDLVADPELDEAVASPPFAPARPASQRPATAPVFVEPALVRHQPAVYPALARLRGLEGAVEFRIRVDAQGRVVYLEPLPPPAGYGFDEAARVAARSAVYRPATRDGVAVEGETRLRIEFRLRSAAGR